MWPTFFWPLCHFLRLYFDFIEIIANIFLGTCADFSLRYLATRHRFEQQAVRNIDQSRILLRIELHSITSQSFAHCQIIYSTRAPWIKMIPFVSKHFYQLSILESYLVLFWWSPGRKEAELVLFILRGQNRHNLNPCNAQMYVWVCSCTHLIYKCISNKYYLLHKITKHGDGESPD